MDLLRDFYEASLNELDRCRRGIRVDPDGRKQAGVVAPMYSRRRAAQLDLDATFNQVSDQTLVGACRLLSSGLRCKRCRSV